MADFEGYNFPSGYTYTILPGATFQNSGDGGLYRYLSGNPALSSSWILISGSFTNDPNTAGWGSSQAGTQWYNNSLGLFRYWTGSSIVSIITSSQVTSQVNSVATPPVFNVYLSPSQSIPNSTWTKITYQTKLFDTNNNYDNATNYRYTPTVAGYYNLTVCAYAGSLGTGDMAIAIYKNGTIVSISDVWGEGLAPFGLGILTTSIQYANGSGDYFEGWIIQHTGGALSLNASPQANYFCGVKVSS